MGTSSIAEIAERHDLVVISDEIHADLTFAGYRHIPYESLGPDVSARAVTITSASKAFNLAGLRWAILHAGNDALAETLEALPGHYLGTPNLFAVEATVAAWTAGDGWLTDVLAMLDENRHQLVGFLADHFAGAKYSQPAATYLAWIDMSALGFGDDPAATFRERGVEVSSGVQFGPQGAGHVRLNFATSPHILAATVQAMAIA